MGQQAPQQQSPPSGQHITEPATQCTQETELNSSSEQQQKNEDEQQIQAEDNCDQPEKEVLSVQEPEPEHQVSSTNSNSSGPKTYANLVKSFPSTTGATSPQAPKLSTSPVSYFTLSRIVNSCRILVNTFLFL